MRWLVVLMLWGMVQANCEAAEAWPQFRGPQANGHAISDRLPLNWSETSNVRWKTAIHDRGWSSPIVAGDQVWVTTATNDGHQLYAVCVDLLSGTIVHDLLIFEVDELQPVAADNTYATPTPVLDETHVYVHFGTYGTACLNSQTGDVVWTRQDLKCDHENGAGPGSSPMLVDNMLILHVDGRDVQYIVALDKTTGDTIWKTDRSVDYSQVPIHQRKAYSMPILAVRADGQQLVSPGAQAIYAYDPINGQELWRIRHRGWSIAPRPVAGADTAYVLMDHDHPELWAVQLDGEGDVTDSHISWKATKGMPARASALLVDDLLYVVTRRGILSCLDTTTGRPVWKKRVTGQYSASPILSGDRIYLCNEAATTTVVTTGRKFKKLAVNRLPEEILMASPAAAGDSLLIRTAGHLYCIEEGTSQE